MKYDTIEYTVSNSIGMLTLNRPTRFNSLNLTMTEELFDVALTVSRTQDVRCLVVRGAGKAFCAGGDLMEVHQEQANRGMHIERIATLLHGALAKLARMNTPVIMSINGVAAGAGFSLALSGDYVVASDSAAFTSAYTAAGLAPDGSSTFYLARHIGVLRAKELFLFNRKLSASEAYDIGLVNQVVSADKLEEETMKLAEKLAKGPTLAFGEVKRLLLDTHMTSLETQMEHEAKAIAAMVESADGKNGIEAFANKSVPQFLGKT